MCRLPQPNARVRSIVQKESMHELSIAAGIVEAVTESAAAYPNARVKAVYLRVGALASVIEDSLQFCWELATEDSLLAGAKLVAWKRSNQTFSLVRAFVCGSLSPGFAPL